VKLNLTKAVDEDILMQSCSKLQQRVKAAVATLFLVIKVKDHRDPLNEEADIRVEIGRLKEDSETIQGQGGNIHEQDISVDQHG
jgi:hypothetical protein